MDTESSTLAHSLQKYKISYSHNVGENSRKKKGKKLQIKLRPQNTSKSPGAQSYSKQTII